MTFADLAMITGAALLGPVLAWPKKLRVPILIGELGVGVVLGQTGIRQLHASDPTFAFLANVGFALVMFVAGSHVPLRDARLITSIRAGVARAIAVGIASTLLAVLLSHLFGTGHSALYSVLLASSSAALILPLLDASGATGNDVLDLLAQVAVADTACIIALPLAIAPSRAGSAAVGALAVVVAAVIVFFLLRAAERSGQRKRLHHISEQRKFALELRISLLVLFLMAALAVRTHVSVMLAGFSLGLAVTAVGEPRRLAHQLFALTEGLFAPLFFVWIGAGLDLRALGAHPKFVVLGAALGVGAAVTHLSMRATGQPAPLAVIAAAQLGVPVAAVALGAQRHLLKPGEPAAVIFGALITVAAATWAARTLPRVAPAAVTPRA